MVTFTDDGVREKNVSALIVDDTIALEAIEMVNVRLTIVSPPSGVSPGTFQDTLVTVVDDDRKSATVK